MNAEQQKQQEIALNRHYEFRHEGTQFVIPEMLDTKLAIQVLKRRLEQETQTIAIDESIAGFFPHDAAIAFSRALKEIYGWADLQSRQTFFGEDPPRMISVEVSPGSYERVPWGQMSFHGLHGYLETSLKITNEGLPAMRVTGKVQQRDKSQVARLCDRTRQLLREKSIYRGRATRICFPSWDDHPIKILETTPRFMDVSQVRADQLVFPTETMAQVRTSVFAPVESTQACRNARIPLKRGILLEGPFGTGKTLCAQVLARKAEENGWTFFYLEDLEDLPAAIEFAKSYQPAVIFAEDIDRAVGEDRDDDANDILNTIDGIDGKHTEIITVLTTNNVELIHPAMLRPGRLDAVIPVRPPDEDAVERLIRLYSGSLLAEDADLTGTRRILTGQIPAVIREVVERSKLAAVANHGDLVLTGPDLETAAAGMMQHLELITPKPRDDRSDRVKAADVLGEHIQAATKNGTPISVTTLPAVAGKTATS